MNDKQLGSGKSSHDEKSSFKTESNIYIVKFDADSHGWLLPYWSQYCASRNEPDGTSPDHPLDSVNSNYFLENLQEYFWRFEAGNEIALLDALHLCRNESAPPPDWVVSGLEAFAINTIRSGRTGKVGRSNNPLARAKQTMKLSKQREVIDQIRAAQKLDLDSENRSIFQFMALPNELKSYFKSHGELPIGTNLEDAVELAELCLRGTPFQATFSTLLKLAKSQIDSPHEISEPSVREALGITGFDDLPLSYAGYYVDPIERSEGHSDKTEVNEKDGFWVTVRLKKVPPV